MYASVLPRLCYIVRLKERGRKRDKLPACDLRNGDRTVYQVNRVKILGISLFASVLPRLRYYVSKG